MCVPRHIFRIGGMPWWSLGAVRLAASRRNLWARSIVQAGGCLPLPGLMMLVHVDVELVEGVLQLRVVAKARPYLSAEHSVLHDEVTVRANVGDVGVCERGERGPKQCGCCGECNHQKLSHQ